MIELKGIIQFRNGGHKYVEVVVSVDDSVKFVTFLVGVDIQPTRGKIITFLAAMYSVLPAEIVWPSHIELESGVE